MKTPSDYLTKYRTRLRKKKCPASVEKDTIISDVTTQKNKKKLKKIVMTQPVMLIRKSQL